MGKHLYQTLLFDKTADLNLNITCEFCEVFKNTFFIEQVRTISSEKGRLNGELRWVES